MKRVKFIGDLKSLIPDGWKFGKAFARNYRNYRKLGVTIWQAGREFTLDEYSKHTFAIFEKAKHGFSDWISEIETFNIGKVCWLLFRKCDGSFLVYGSESYKEARKLSFSDYDAYIEQYQEVRIDIETLELVSRMLENNLICEVQQ